MRRLELIVAGMTCPRCVREVTALLRDVPGVATLTADATTGTVLVVGSFQTRALVAALSETPYTVAVCGPTQDSTTTEGGQP